MQAKLGVRRRPPGSLVLQEALTGRLQVLLLAWQQL